jgi:restriction endonuclease S subunit
MLPKTWLTTTLGEVFRFRGGGTPDKKQATYWNGEIPWASVKDVKGLRLSSTIDSITKKGLESSATSLAKPGDVIVVTRISPGETVIPTIETAINQDLKVVTPEGGMPPLFVHYLFKSLSKAIIAKSSGTTVLGVRLNELGTIDFPLPPLAEQKRIVAKIEELFSELDAGEESLRRARRQLGVYRQSLLKQAFEGKLTEQWRKQNPEGCSTGWHKTTVSEIGRIETGTTPPTANPRNYGDELPFFKPTDLEQGQFVKTAREYLSESGKQCARVLPRGSILVTCIGATIGKTGLAQVMCATNQQINSISPDEDTLPVFAYYQVISPAFQDQIKTNASSTTLPILNKSKFSALSFTLCSLPEQREIVRLLDEQFTVIEQNEREIDAALKRSAALRQSILKKAFTGQLVPQDPTDEPASVLLERIRKERDTGSVSKKKTALKKAKPI